MITAQDIREQVELDGVEWHTLRVENNDVIITLEGFGAVQSFKIRRSTYDATTIETISKSCQLVAFIMRDPLLHRGVENIACVSSDGQVHTAEILFYNHKIDMIAFFRDGAFDTRSALLAVLRACQEESPDKTICSISFEEIPPGENVAVLSNEKFTYNEKHIRRWISERGTSPFTRAPKTLDDIQIIQHVYAPVPVADQPNLQPPKKRKVERWRYVGAIDKSTSMHACSKTVEAIEEFFLTKKEEAKEPTSVTLYTFNHKVQKVYETDDIRTMNPFTAEEKVSMRPGGMTALYDAICHAGQELLDELQHGENALLCILTDGEDTASHSSMQEARSMLETLKGRGVQCIFLAANIGDARVRGADLGFSPDTSLTFEPDTMEEAWASLREASQGNQQVQFTQMQRQVSAPTQFDDDTRVDVSRYRTQ